MEYQFRPKTKGQKRAIEDTAPNLLFAGPWGTGKTHLGAVKAYVMGAMYPGNVVALIRKKRVDLKPTLWKWFVDKVLPPAIKARLAIEAGVRVDWERLVGDGGDVIGIDRFGASAPGERVMKEYGFNVANVVKRAMRLIGK